MLKKNHFFKGNIYNSNYGIYLNNAKDSIFKNISILNSTNIPIYLDSATFNNLFINLEVIDNLSSSKFVQNLNDTYENYLIYNNTFGKIKWINKDFLTNLTLNKNLTNFNKIKIKNNLVYLDSNYFSISDLNSSANITLRFKNNSFIEPKIFKNDEICLDCYNFTSLKKNEVVFNVSSWSNYSLKDVGCGNGIVNTNEDCDGTNLNGKTCLSFGFDKGVLSCNDCKFDFSNCLYSSSCDYECEDFDYECGFHNLCGDNVSCGVCNESFICVEGICIKEESKTIFVKIKDKKSTDSNSFNEDLLNEKQDISSYKIDKKEEFKTTDNIQEINDLVAFTTLSILVFVIIKQIIFF